MSDADSYPGTIPCQRDGCTEPVPCEVYGHDMPDYIEVSFNGSIGDKYCSSECVVTALESRMDADE